MLKVPYSSHVFDLLFFGINTITLVLKSSIIFLLIYIYIYIYIYISVNSNQLMHISVFIKNTLKVYLKFLLPRHVSDHTGIHPQGAIIRS